MEFFDKKEDVIDLVLTKRGKQLFSEGKLKAAYYTFHDTDISYDSLYDGKVDKKQNEISTRIKDTPYIKAQSQWSDEEYEKKKEKISAPYTPQLGKFDIVKQRKPAWNLSVKQGEISGSVAFTPLEKNTDSEDSEKIPQIDLVCEYLIRPENKNKQLFLKRSSDNLLLKIVEENTPIDKENFDIEAFKYDYSSNENKPKLIPLSFDLKGEFNDENFFWYFDVIFDNNGKDVETDFEKLAPAAVQDEDECA